MSTNEAGTKQAKISQPETDKEKAGIGENIIKGKFSDSVSNINASVEKGVEELKSNLSDKTERLTEMAQQTLEKANNLGSRASDAVKDSASYVRSLDFEQAGAAVKKVMKEQPGLSIAIAGVAGLIVGLIVARRLK